MSAVSQFVASVANPAVSDGESVAKPLIPKHCEACTLLMGVGSLGERRGWGWDLHPIHSPCPRSPGDSKEALDGLSCGDNFRVKAVDPIPELKLLWVCELLTKLSGELMGLVAVTNLVQLSWLKFMVLKLMLLSM